MKLDFYAGHAFAVHFHNCEAGIAKVKAFAAFGDETELIKDEAADGGVRGVFGEGDIVLRFEVADV